MSAPVPGGGGRARLIGVLGTTQTLAWASSYYLPAIVADPIAAELTIPAAWLFGAFSAALLLMGVLGPFVGREIDRRGGRLVLSASNVVLAAGLVMLGCAQGPLTMAAAWMVLGAGMAMGLYDAAFATLAGIFGTKARGPITGITLIAGFASTVGWPATALLTEAYGWRTACFVWAAIHLVICLPLNRFFLPGFGGNDGPASEPAAAAPKAAADKAGTGQPERRQMLLLAVAFAAGWFVTGAMATHLPRLLQEMGSSPASAIAIAALVGPAQVAARLAEFGLFRKLHPLYSARLAVALHPLGGVIFAIFGAPVAAVFAIAHGAGNGLLTIARGTLPLALFGATGYGLKQGILGAPARLTQATAPFLFAIVLEVSPRAAIALTVTLMLVALGALIMLRRPDDAGSTVLPHGP